MAMDQMKDIVFNQFKTAIEAKGMMIQSVESDGLINILWNGRKFRVSLDNLTRNYEQRRDPRVITDFIETFAASSAGPLATWEQVKDHVYTTLMPLTSLVGDPIYQPITMIFGKVYVYTGNEHLTFIDYGEMERWGITQPDLHEQAAKNTELLLDDASVRYELLDGRKLGMIELPFTALKTSLLFAPSIRKKIEPEFGFPFYAVLPVRDSCYIFSEEDFEFFTSRIGRVIVEQYKSSGYPLTTEVMKFEEDGADAVGAYPVE